MKNFSIHRLGIALTAFFAISATAPQASAWDFSRTLQGLGKVIQSSKITDEQMAEYVHQYITQLDAKSQVAPANSTYTVRLNKLTTGLTDVEGIPLNFKVYITDEVNAFACADGSVRVYSGLMDLMTDDEVLGVIGHEVGHVAHHDSKNAFKKALQTSALKDVLASSSGRVAALTDSQLGAIGETLVNNKYSRQQETAADDYGYEFLKSHGKNPWAMAQAFSKLENLEQQSGNNSGGMAKLFSDHPDTAKRIQNIARRCQADGIAKPGTATSSTAKASAKKSYTTSGTKTSGTKSSDKKSSKPASAKSSSGGFTLTPSNLPAGSRLKP